jgi:hypothetical protein
MQRYIPPTFNDPNPYPKVTDPQTGAPFTAERLTEIHKRLQYQFLLMAAFEVTSQTLQQIPDFGAIYEAADRLASACLFVTLDVADADSDGGILRPTPPEDGLPNATGILLLQAQALIEAAIAQEVV